MTSGQSQKLRFRLKERRVSLQDNLWQIFLPNEEMTLLNLEKQEPQELVAKNGPDEMLTVIVDLDE
mgnify:CR=1 FL=1